VNNIISVLTSPGRKAGFGKDVKYQFQYDETQYRIDLKFWKADRNSEI
jgi:hypothetical protein